MASNPFHLWLGISPDVQSPNHFELLGVSPTETDQTVLEQAARARLKLLQNVDAGKHGEVLEKIKKRVKVAYAVLKDPGKRKKYESQLGIDPAISSNPTAPNKKPSSSPKPASTSQVPQAIPAENDESTDPATFEFATTNPAATTSPTANEPAINKATTVESAVDEIPMALPVADAASPLPVPSSTKHKSPGTNTPAEPPTIQINEPDETDAGIVLAPVDATPRTVKIKPKAVGRQRSFFVPFICSVFLVGGVAGIAYLAMNSEQFFGTSNNAQANNKTATQNKGPAQAKTDPLNTNEPSNNDAESNKTNSNSASEPNGDGDSTTEGEPDISDVTNKLLGDRPTNLTHGPETATDVAGEVKTESLSFADEVRFRRYLTAAQLAILRRDKQAVDMNLENAGSIFLRFEDDPNLELDPAQTDFPEALDATAKVRDLVLGFWRQVVDSAQSISGGQELDVAGKIVGFVEGTDSFVIVRSGGRNLKYTFDKLPPGLAKIIAEQGAKPDIPTWRMQQAAFYAVHKELDLTYGDKAIDKAQEAEADGHDPTSIRTYVEFVPQTVGRPGKQLEQLSEEEISTELDAMRINSIDVRGNLRPDQAVAAVDSMLESSLNTQDPRVRAIRVYAALLAARKSADAYLLLDTINEFGLWVVIDFNQQIEDGLLELAASRREMTIEQKYRFCAVVSNYLNEFMDNKAKKRLVRMAKEISKKNDFDFKF